MRSLSGTKIHLREGGRLQYPISSAGRHKEKKQEERTLKRVSMNNPYSTSTTANKVIFSHRHTNSHTSRDICSRLCCVPTWSQCRPPLAANVAPQSVWGPIWPAARSQCNHHPAASCPHPPSTRCTILRAHIQNHSWAFNFLWLSSASSTLLQVCKAHKVPPRKDKEKISK